MELNVINVDYCLICEEITNRLQTARPTVRQLLFRYLLPWLCNMELVDPNLPPPATGFTYPSYYSEKAQGAGPTAGFPSNFPASGTFVWSYRSIQSSISIANCCIEVNSLLQELKLITS